MKEIPIWLFLYSKDNPIPPEDRILQAASAYATYHGADTEFGKIGKTEKGKPYFINRRDIGFSISHSKAYWAIALGPGQIGLDIQEIGSHNSLKIAKRFFHPEEFTFLQKQPAKDQGDCFYQIWTAKESYVKYTGTGISGHFSKFSTVDVEKNIIKTDINGVVLSFLPVLTGYKICICFQSCLPLQISVFEEE